MGNKVFSERLNRELDSIGVPQRNDERVDAFAKLVKLPRFKAEALLQGNTNPDPSLLNTIAQELEVSVDWLMGKSETRQN